MILSGLNKQQREAAETINGYVEIIAGAGSGKTRTITYKIAHMIKECGIPDSSILALTFTNKAAKEMKDRIEKLIGSNSNVTATTFHSFAYKFLIKFPEKIGFKSNFSIADDEAQVEIIKKIINNTKNIEEWLDIKLIKNLIGKAKDHACFDEKDAEKFYQTYTLFGKETIKKICNIFKEYNKKLKEINMMDFDDLLLYMYKILKDKQIKKLLQSRFKYFLVDEYQDTNWIQGEIVNMMSDSSKNLCVVGDPDQSIYAFRGAEVSIINDFPKKHPKTKIVKLEQNYRSTPQIIEGANAVISNNPQIFDKKLFASKPKGMPIKITSVPSTKEEAKYIIEKIKEKVKEKEYNYEDFTILYRANFQSRALEQELVLNKIPYKIYGGIEFYQRKEIKDLLAFIKLYTNPNDTISFERITKFIRIGIGPKGLENIEIFRKKNNLNYLELLEHSSKIKGLSLNGKKALISYSEIFKQIKEKFKTKKQGLIDFLFEKTDYKKLLIKSGEFERIENVNELSESFDEKFQDNITLAEYIAEITMYTSSDEPNDGNFVKLMTVHRSKGLEFNYVFIAGTAEGLFPMIKLTEYDTTSYQTLLEEERRLFYVAMTRAMKCLEITEIRTKGFYEVERSQFINELKHLNIEFNNIEKERTDENEFRKWRF